MLYEHDIAGCLAETIGDHGLDEDDLDAALARAAPALAELKRLAASGGLPLLQLPEKRDDLARLGAVADEFRRRFAHVLVLGIGGSSLGGQTVAALADQGFGPRPGAPCLHFMENIDPAGFAALFAALDPAATGVIAISKSGGTAETLAQLLAVLDWLRQSLGPAAPGDRCLALTEPRDNPLRRLAAAHGIRCLDHHPGIGGRYSVLSNVGVLPALIAGLDAAALRQGAATVLEATLAARQPRESAPALGAALAVALAERRGIGVTVLMPYVDRLAPFGLWFRQLWAESLGKDGKGTTPVRALGAVDQHSQLQLYLAGPADKLFTLLVLQQDGQGALLPPDLAGDPALAYLAGRRLGDLLAAEQRATATSLLRHGRPTRVLRLPRLDEASLGALFMHFMLETIIAAALWGVDAFDQPAVEQGKVLARQYLGERARGGAQ
ncbi:MAG TPA: glucose-6-phosphate isomerase [Stellaceae bacterium]|nr:glucose-6-phosphate isomerase [Stellaceae bacterium]